MSLPEDARKRAADLANSVQATTDPVQRDVLATLYQFQSHPKWHERASRSEIREVEDIDRLIADLRKRRQTIINRVHMRTEVWAAHHPERKQA